MLRFLFLVVLFYFLFRLFYRVFAKSRKSNTANGGRGGSYRQPREGEIHVDHIPEDQEGSEEAKNEGEFIDYEDVSEEDNKNQSA